MKIVNVIQILRSEKTVQQMSLPFKKVEKIIFCIGAGIPEYIFFSLLS